MLLPLLLGIGIVATVLALSAKPRPPVTPANSIVEMSNAITSAARSAADELTRLVSSGSSVPRHTVNSAIAEAFEKGDYATVRSLHARFPLRLERNRDQAIGVSDESSVGGAQIVVGKNSPIRDVGNDEWTEFIDKLRTQPMGYKDDSHVGAYHHHIKRLQEIGIDPLTLKDDASQYSALESDLKNVLEHHHKLINDYAGDVVKLNGQEICVTRSGILGVIKAAGVEGAKQWLANDSDRMSYPNTTQQFLKTNGLF